MNSKPEKFIVYHGDPANPQNQTARLFVAENEETVWRFFPRAISVQRYAPIRKDWRRTPEPDWDKLRDGITVM